MTDSASISVGVKNVPHQERVRDVDADTSLGLDAWRPLHEACDRIHLLKPKSDLEMQQVSRLWNGRRDVELRLLGYPTQDFDFLRYFPGWERFNVQVPYHQKYRWHAPCREQLSR